MSSRDSILKKVKAAQPSPVPLPGIPKVERTVDVVAKFSTLLQSIGGRAVLLPKEEPVAERVVQLFPEAKRIVSSITAVERYFLAEYKELLHHSLHDVDVAIIEAQFGVAENSAVWVTEEDLKIRVLPFICEHLVAVVEVKNIVPTLHEAYERIGTTDYGFGVFIAGPSKTADIEQSLVLGAHGPKTMTVLLVEET
jgi:L-lactate dehydrogenase complex protein LldG